MLVPLGEMSPDTPPQGQLRLAANVYASVDGYQPVGALQALTPALSGFLGGAAFVGPTGNTAFLAGDGANLYNYTGSAWSPVFSRTATSWRFAQFGNNIICANGGALVSYNISTGTAVDTAGGPPVCDMVAIVQNQVVVAGDPNNRQTLTWSGFNDSNGWTAGDNQSDFQELPDGGEITGIANGEYGLIFQRNTIRRMDYVGPPLIYQIDRITEEIGCMAKGSLSQAGKLVFFLSERGFMKTIGGFPTPIGNEKIDRTFFERYSRSDIENMQSAIDPKRQIVCWSMHDRIWVYNWTLDRWSVIELNNRGIFSGFTSDTSTDALVWANTDAGAIEVDSPVFQGGNPLLLIVDSQGVIGTPSGDNLEARFEVADHEFARQKVRIRTARPQSDAINVTLVLDVKERAGDAPDLKTSRAARRNGDLPIRARARNFSATITIPAGERWSYIKGMDYNLEGGGYRGAP